MIEKHVPEIFTILAARAKSPLTDVYNDVSTENVFTQLQLANMATTKPAVFADQQAKDAILKLAAAAQNAGLQDARVLIPAAACGDKPSLKKLLDLYRNPTSNGTNVSPNGAAMEHNLAKKYLATIVCQRDGDKITQVTDHIDQAVYDPAGCIWTVPKID